MRSANKPLRHHYLPRFYLNNWSVVDDLVYIFLKNGRSRKMKKVSTKDICLEKNLYTRSKGRVDVEQEFLADLDAKASRALSQLIGLGVDKLTDDERRDFARFVNTLHFRHPDLLNELKQFSEYRRQKGLERAEKDYLQTGQDIRHLFKKEKYDDSSAMMRYHADDGLEDILNSHWELLFNKSSLEFLTSDFPLKLLPLGGSNTHGGISLPDKFLLLLPLNPQNLLLITNVPAALRQFKEIPSRDLVKKTNLLILGLGSNIIISSTLSSEKFILNHTSG